MALTADILRYDGQADQKPRALKKNTIFPGVAALFVISILYSAMSPNVGPAQAVGPQPEPQPVPAALDFNNQLSKVVVSGKAAFGGMPNSNNSRLIDVNFYQHCKDGSAAVVVGFERSELTRAEAEKINLEIFKYDLATTELLLRRSDENRISLIGVQIRDKNGKSEIIYELNPGSLSKLNFELARKSANQVTCENSQ